VIDPAAVANWFPTLPVEFRILTVQAGTLVLEHLSPGRWVSFEMVNIAEQTIYTDAHLTYFYELEQIWKAHAPYGYRQHHGKSFATGPYTGLPRPYPFQNATQTSWRNFYSASVVSAFTGLMAAYDPHGVFRAGAGLEFMGYPGYTTHYDPRHDLGDRCLSGLAAECYQPGASCIANTCEMPTPCSAFVPCPSPTMYCNLGVCEDTAMPYAHPCNANQQCASGACCAGYCSDNASWRKMAGGSLCTESCECSSGFCFILVCI